MDLLLDSPMATLPSVITSPWVTSLTVLIPVEQIILLTEQLTIHYTSFHLPTKPTMARQQNEQWVRVLSTRYLITDHSWVMMATTTSVLITLLTMYTTDLPQVTAAITALSSIKLTRT